MQPNEQRASDDDQNVNSPYLGEMQIDHENTRTAGGYAVPMPLPAPVADETATVAQPVEPPAPASTPLQPAPQSWAQPTQAFNYNTPEMAQPQMTAPQPTGPTMWPQSGMQSVQTPQPVQQPTQQFGGPMAELPALAPPPAAPKKQRRHVLRWTLLAIATLLVVAGAVVAVPLLRAGNSVADQEKTITTSTKQLQALGKQQTITAANLTGIDKSGAFMSVFKTASQQQNVQTTWDVYTTAKAVSGRPDQYNLYRSTIDYHSKKFNFEENSHDTNSLYQTRCVDGKEYIYDAKGLFSAAPAWQAASDSTACNFTSAKSHFNDGLNTGGLSGTQAAAFIHGLLVSKTINVNDMSLVSQKGKQYIRFDVTITPHKQSNKEYQGLQAFLTAFGATGQNATSYPYNFYGQGNQGVHLLYYVDPTTQLPVYAQMTSTPTVDSKTGKQQKTTAYTHRFIEYAFPAKLAPNTLDGNAPITFATWPEK